MRRLLVLLSLTLALVAGGVAVAEKADDLLVGQSPVIHPADTRPDAGRPELGPPTEGLPIVDRTKTPAEPACFSEQVLVKFVPGADPASVAARHGTTIASSIPQLGIYVLAVPLGTQAEKIAALSADAEVEYAEPNAVMSIPERPATGPSPCADAAPTRE